MSGEVSPEGTRLGKKRSTVTDVNARYSSSSPCPTALPPSQSSCLPASLFGSNSGLSCKTRGGNALRVARSLLPFFFPPSERQLDHLRRHYLSLFLCNFPLRTPTCQMTNPKATSWHRHRPRPRPPAQPAPTDAACLSRGEAGRGRGRRTTIVVVDAALRRPFERGPHFTLRSLTNEGFCGGCGSAAADKTRKTTAPPTSTTMVIISSRIFSAHK